MDNDDSSSFPKGFYLFFFITFFIILSCFAREQKLYYRLHSVWTRSFTPSIADMDDDGKDELVINYGDQTDVRDWKLRYFYYSFRISLNGPFYVQLIPATNPDSSSFLITYRQADTIFVKILTPTKKTHGQSIPVDSLKDFYSFVRSPGTPISDFYQSFSYTTTFINKNKDKRRLFRFNTGWDKQGKRGLLCTDIKSQKILWQYTIGPTIYKIILRDIDNDGTDEIIVSTYAPANGVKGSETKDDSSYIIVLNAEGKRLWKRNFGPYWTGAYANVGDFEGKGKKKILVCQMSNRDFPNHQDKVFILDPLTGKTLIVRAIGDRLSAPRARAPNICRDFNGDGKDEIVLGNSDGYIRMLGGDLSEIISSKNFGQPIFVSAVEDLDGDGNLEIVCYMPDEKIVVLDNTLRELCSYPVSFSGILPIVHNGAEPCLLLSYKVNGNPQTTLLKFEKSTIPFPVMDTAKSRLTWGTITFFFFSLLLLFWYGKRRFDQQFLTVIAQNDLSDKLLLLNKRQKIKYIGEAWTILFDTHFLQARGKNVREFLRNSKFNALKNGMEGLFHSRKIETTVSISNGSSKTNSYRLTIRYVPISRLYSFMLFDTSEQEYFKQMQQWATIAQRLAHGIKNPLTTVKLNAEELDHFLEQKAPSQANEASEYLTAITEQVDRLKRMSDGFMRFVEFEKTILKPADINELVNDLVPQWFPGKSSRIIIDYDLAADLPNALLDEKQFEYAFRNIFFNAVESFDEKGGRIIISTRFVQVFQQVETSGSNSDFIELQLQIQDTGQGIPPELLDKIMQPYVSSKPGGTGLGLSIVQKIMDSHGGELHIDSQQGAMTTVTLRFKAESKKNI
ncbi:MAG: hypothetical protein GXO75_17970 [Calditrichaeota bacterium]|nr:hypothetical protein [Calditrichota bacterium]